MSEEQNGGSGGPSTGQKVRRVLVGTSALAVAIKTEVDVEHGEIAAVSVFGLPVFRRTPEAGLPILFGIRFPRWIRGHRGA